MPEARILFVDDESAVTDGVRRALRRRVPWDIRTTNSGAEALRLLDRERFDVIVSDERMPGMSGSELLSRVAREHPHCIRIILTGQASVDSAIRAINEAGIYRFLTKPCRADDLVSCLGDALRSRAAAETPAALPAGDRGAAIDASLASLHLVFQPIVSLSAGRVFGYEALMRSEASELRTPAELLGAAESEGRTADVDARVFELAAAAAGDLPSGALLFVNLHPRTLAESFLYEPEAPLSGAAGRIVLEVTERATLAALPDVQGSVAALRALGFRVAVDDLGSGYAGLTYLIQLEPDFVKYDRELIAGIDGSPPRRKLLRSMEGLCRELGVRTIAEGVETGAEREALEALGCDLLQGFHFARPAKGFVEPASLAALRPARRT